MGDRVPDGRICFDQIIEPVQRTSCKHLRGIGRERKGRKQKEVIKERGTFLCPISKLPVLYGLFLE